jgi:hypothetical protein
MPERSKFVTVAASWISERVTRIGLRISGVEVTQAIQYYDARSHLTDAADRGADNSIMLVADKPAWVRVYVEPGLVALSVPNVSGTLTVQRPGRLGWDDIATLPANGLGTVNAASTTTYAQQRGSLGNSLNFVIPRQWMRGRLRLVARIRVGAGSVRDETTIEVDASLLQTLRIRGIPVRYWGKDAAGNNVQLSEPGLARFQSSLAWTCLTYPVSATPSVTLAGTFTWSEALTGTAMNGACTTSWNDLNFWLRIAKLADGNRPGLVYLGLLPSGIPIGGVSGCGAPGAVAAARDTDGIAVAHEIGHFLGFSHAPCGSVGTSADPNYPAYEPYDTVSNRQASIGEYGLDVSNGAIFPPSSARDYMSYCVPPWMSLYHYGKLFYDDHFDPNYVGGRPRWWDDYVDYVPQLVPEWNLPDPPPWWRDRATLEPEPVIAIFGTLDVDGTVEVQSVSRVHAVASSGPSAPTRLRAELVDEGGKVLARGVVSTLTSFGDCSCGGAGAEAMPMAFEAFVPDVGRGAAMRIVEGSQERWRRDATRGPGRPRVEGAQVEDEHLVVRWGIDGERGVEHWVRWSDDRGATWHVLHVGGPEEEIRTPVHTLPSGEFLVHVVVHDGFSTEMSEPVSVEIPARAPTAAILHPRQGEALAAGGPLRLWGVATASDGSSIETERLRWFIDGEDAARGDDVWLDCPRDEGWHVATFVCEDDNGRDRTDVEFAVTGDGSRPRWPSGWDGPRRFD